MHRLKELRENKKLTQSQLGEQIGAKKSAISLWESGKRQPDQDTLIRLAALFGVSVDYLLGRETTDQMTVTREGPIEVIRFDGTKKDGKSNMLAAIFAELETMSEEDLKVALQHARFLKSQK